MKQILLAFFPKKEKQTNSDLIPKGVKIVYPFEGYENLSLGERYKVIGEGMIENKLNLKK